MLIQQGKTGYMKRWKDYTEADWKAALKQSKCVVGCNVTEVPCMHLNYYLLKTGNTASYTDRVTMAAEPLSKHLKSNPDLLLQEQSFRVNLDPITTQTIDGPKTITQFQQDILVLKYVYDMSLREIADNLGSSVDIVNRLLKKSLVIVKERYGDL